MLGRRVYRTVQLRFKYYSTSVSVNQRLQEVAVADGNVGVTSTSAPERPDVAPQTPEPLATPKPFSDIPGKFYGISGPGKYKSLKSQTTTHLLTEFI